MLQIRMVGDVLYLLKTAGMIVQEDAREEIATSSGCEDLRRQSE
jgi:hypothetical protein